MGVRVRPVAQRVAALLALALIAPGVAAGQLPRAVADPARAGGVVARHNPIFGLGPQTIWRGGVGVSLEGEVTPASGAIEATDQALHAELTYGATQDVSLILALPLALRRSERGLVPGVSQVDRDATGVGDATLRAKWRFFHRFAGPTQYHAAVIGGVKLPLASTSSEPPIGTGSVDFLLGATISRDGLRYYLWTSALVRVNGEAFDTKRGTEYRYDAAVGLRPWIPKYTGLDPLLVVELNGVTAARTVVNGLLVQESGGTVLAVSPGFWLTYRNWALQGGLKLPVYRNLRGAGPELDYTVVVKIETHM